ncbi:MAG: rane protein [Pedosphaera sp.]|nr:rane protein [Pedosphaera sp.]
MSATISPSQSISTGSPQAVPEISAAEIDASCRAPVMLLFLSAAGWVLASSFFGIIASLKFHKPVMLADYSWLTYGRVHPAASNALVYGFGLQAGLGVLLWLVAHLGRTKLASAPLVIAGWLFWNVGVTLGILGIIGGDSTGYEMLELPRYASVPMFFGYLGIGLAGMLTFHQRRERELYISQWFLLAALFWFPWIYSSANLLLVAKPVRGVMQAVIDAWYANNLTTVWFGLVGLGAAFYLIPKITKRPLASHYLGLFTFWTLIIFGSWSRVPAGAPVPAWLPALSTFAAVLTLVPILAVAVNVKQTLCGYSGSEGCNPALKFIAFGMAAYVLSGLMSVGASLGRVSKITNFTWFVPAQMQLVIYGFFAMTMFGAIYYIVPKLTQREFCKPKMVAAHFWLAMLGIVLYAAPLAIGGVKQGLALNDAKTPFLDVVTGTLPFLRASTTGDLLMAVGHLIFLMNLAGLLVKLGHASYKTAMSLNTKAAGVAS